MRAQSIRSEGAQLVTIGRKASEFLQAADIPIRRQVSVAQALSIETAQ